jgi:hypothetical protein
MHKINNMSAADLAKLLAQLDELDFEIMRVRPLVQKRLQKLQSGGLKKGSALVHTLELDGDSIYRNGLE